MNGAAVKRLRRRMGLTQPQLGAVLGGVHWVTVGRYERGSPIPPWQSALLAWWECAARDHPEYVNADNLKAAAARCTQPEEAGLRMLAVVLDAAFYEPDDDAGG